MSPTMRRLRPAFAGSGCMVIMATEGWGVQGGACRKEGRIGLIDAVRCCCWQVGWRRSGLGLWTPSGCRLLCSLRQAGAHALHQPQTPGTFKSAPAHSLEVSALIEPVLCSCSTGCDEESGLFYQ